MKILQVITSLRQGGAERIVVDISKGLKNCGDEVEIFILDGTDTPLTKELEKAGILIHKGIKGYFNMWNPLMIFPLMRLLKKGNFDIVHSHNTMAQALTAIVAGNYVKTVTTEHNTKNRRRKFFFLKIFDKCMYSRYKSVICVSKKVKSNLTSFLGNKNYNKKLKVISNGIDIEKFNKIYKTIKDKKDKKRIIMVAGFRKQKDHATLIKAMNFLPTDYTLDLVGEGKLQKNCECLAKELGLNSRINFLGSREDIPELYAKAGIAVLSSHYEGMPLSLFEAMAAGVPIIASSVPGIKDLTGNEIILFEKGDSRHLAECLRYICENEEIYNECIEKGKSKVILYDIQTTIRNYRNLYHAIMKTVG